MCQGLIIRERMADELNEAQLQPVFVSVNKWLGLDHRGPFWNMRTKQEFGLFLKANEKLLKDFKERGTRFAF